MTAYHCPFCGASGRPFILAAPCAEHAEQLAAERRRAPFRGEPPPSKAVGGGLAPYSSDFGRIPR